jgi:hypothetical protein
MLDQMRSPAAANGEAPNIDHDDTLIGPGNKPTPFGTQAPGHKRVGTSLRVARCPACGHKGGVPRDAPVTAKLRCVACGTSALVRQCVGPRPAVFRHRSSAQRATDAAAADVLERYGNSALNDPVDDLFRDADSL